VRGFLFGGVLSSLFLGFSVKGGFIQL
jgi:hypothetical protein